MPGLPDIVFTFLTFLKTGNPLILSQGCELISPTRQDFMYVGLVTNIKNKFIRWRIKDIMHGQRQLHHTEITGQMSSGFGNALNQKDTYLLCQILQLRNRAFLDVLRLFDIVDVHATAPLSFFASSADQTALLPVLHPAAAHQAVQAPAGNNDPLPLGRLQRPSA